MTAPDNANLLEILLQSRVVRRLAVFCLTVFAIWWLVTAEYHPMVLSVLVSLYFAFYVAMRWLFWLEADKMTPRRYQVGISWALVGYNSLNDEFDIRPVRVYFLLMAIEFTGLVVRPLVRMVVA